MEQRYYDIQVIDDKIGFGIKVKYKIDFINEKNEVVYTDDRLQSLTMMIKLLEEGRENSMEQRYYDIQVIDDKIGFDIKVKYKIDFINEKNEVVYTADRLKSLTMMIKLLEECNE